MVSGGTDNHLLLLDFVGLEMTGARMEDLLGQANITVNKNMVPYDSRTPFTTSGIRVGTPAITTRGLQEDLMPRIVQLIDDTLANLEDETYLQKVQAKVYEMVKDFPLFAW